MDKKRKDVLKIHHADEYFNQLTPAKPYFIEIAIKTQEKRGYEAKIRYDFPQMQNALLNPKRRPPGTPFEMHQKNKRLLAKQSAHCINESFHVNVFKTFRPALAVSIIRDVIG